MMPDLDYVDAVAGSDPERDQGWWLSCDDGRPAGAVYSERWDTLFSPPDC